MCGKRSLLKGAVLIAVGLCFAVTALGLAAEQRVHLQIYGNWPPTPPDDVAYQTLQMYLRMYEEKNPHVTIEDLGREHSQSKILNMLITGTAPDLIALGNMHVLRFHSMGLLDEVPAHFAEKMRENLFPAAVEGSTLFGKIVSVPVINNISTLYYNRRVLEESGLAPQPPATWEELETAGARAARFAPDGTIERGGLQLSTNWHESAFYRLLLLGAGARYLDDEGNLVVNSDSLRFLIDKVIEWNRTFLARTSSTIFASGNAAFSHAASGFLESYRGRYPFDFYQDIGAAATPAGPAGRYEYQFSNGYAVPPGPNQDEVWKFLEWLYFSSDGPGGMTPQGHIHLVRNIPPLHRGDVQAMLNADPLLAPYFATFIDNISVAENSQGRYVEHGLSNDPLQEMFHAILDRGAAPEQAIEEMVIKLRTMMEETRAARQ